MLSEDQYIRFLQNVILTTWSVWQNALCNCRVLAFVTVKPKIQLTLQNKERVKILHISNPRIRNTNLFCITTNIGINNTHTGNNTNKM